MIVTENNIVLAYCTTQGKVNIMEAEIVLKGNIRIPKGGQGIHSVVNETVQ